MANQRFKISILYIFLLFSAPMFSQTGIVTGTLTDSNGLVLPGVNIIIKGTNIGTQTDFDGNYSIPCLVGDVLTFSFVSMKPQEVTVTASMFGIKTTSPMVKNVPVESLFSDAYSDAILDIKKAPFLIEGIEDSKRTYNKNAYFNYNRIKDINILKDRVNINYFSPDIYYEIGYNNKTHFQFIKNKNLPELQSTFSQGAPQNNEAAFLGPETGNPFSYGPKLNVLGFDGSNYAYDRNGQLVPIANSTGKPSNIYDNRILETATKSLHYLFFNITTDNTFLGFDYTHNRDQDLYGREKSKADEFVLSFRNSPKNSDKLSWDAFVKYKNQRDNQPNINGFNNNLLLNLWSTPASFENAQGAILPDNTQRSFSPTIFNNPEWLLDQNKNAINKSAFVASLQNKWSINDAITIKSKLSYITNKNSQKFGLAFGTVGFETGYTSLKKIDNRNFNALLNFNYNKLGDDSAFKVVSLANFRTENLEYFLSESDGFAPFSFTNPQNNSTNGQRLNRNTLQLQNKLSYALNAIGVELTLSNTSYVSSIQKNNWFLPTIQAQLQVDKIINFGDIYNFILSASTSFDVNDAPLMYNNQSHNSLLLVPSESLSYTSNQDLFLNHSISLEKRQNFDLNTSMTFHVFDTNFDFGLTYFNTKTKGSVFPVRENNAFILKNIADIKSSGIEINLSANVYSHRDFQYSPSFTFSTYRTKVLRLRDNSNRVPIAGFSSTSKNLIVGKPAGVIVGSAYARDSQGRTIIDNLGFPTVNLSPQIIGDPTPDFNLGFSNALSWKSFKLSFTIDLKKGGDVWNGTQNVLNYLGTSQQSVNERTITNFIFDGVDQLGNSNTIPVDFANPENGLTGNRFVRYGFEGVAEDAIEDGSYINFKSIDLTYTLKKREQDTFFREVTIGVYGTNLFTWSKFRGASPYSSIYNTTSGEGLHFFNAPIVSEIGLKATIKI